MSSKTTFLVPKFDKSSKGKVHDFIEVISPTTLYLPDSKMCYRPAIASTGFSSHGVYVVSLKVHEIAGGYFTTGFTDKKTIDTDCCRYAGDDEAFRGTSLCCYSGCFCPLSYNYLPEGITRNAKEIISIVTISNDGKKNHAKHVQWIVDGNEGRIVECTKHFGRGNLLFLSISLSDDHQRIECIPFDQIKSRSPKIDELMKEFNNQRSQQAISSAALTSQLRESGQRRQRDQESDQITVPDIDEEKEEAEKQKRQTQKK